MEQSTWTVSRSFMVCLVLLATMAEGKIFESSIGFDKFFKYGCQFVTKYGAIGGRFAVRLEYNIIGKFAAERSKELSESTSFEIKLIAVGREGHKKLTSLIEQETPDSYERIKNEIQKEITLNIINDGVDFQKYEMKGTGIQFFYFCDHLGKVKKYQESKNKDNAKSQEEFKQKVSEGGDFLKEIMSIFSHGSSFKYKLELMSNEGDSELFSHHSIEEHGHFSTLFVFFCMFGGLLYYVSKKTKDFYKSNEALDYPLMVVSCSLILHMLGLLNKFIQVWLYSRSGNKFEFVSVMSRLWYLAGDVLMSFLLIVMTKGWGISEVSLFDDYEIEFVIGILLVVLRYLWVVLGFFVDSDNEDIFHIYDGITGKFELLNTLVLFGWFIYSIQSSKLFKAQKLQKWKQQLILYGISLFLIKPFFILLTYLLHYESQYMWSTLISYSCYFAVCFLMSMTMTDRRRAYMKVALSNLTELASFAKTD